MNTNDWSETSLLKDAGAAPNRTILSNIQKKTRIRDVLAE